MSQIYIHAKRPYQVFGVVVGDPKNLKINILTKKRNVNLDIFLCFTKISENQQKKF